MSRRCWARRRPNCPWGSSRTTYRVTDAGLRVALFISRLSARTLRPGLATVMPDTAANDSRLRRAFEQLEHAMDDWCAEAKVAA